MENDYKKLEDLLENGTYQLTIYKAEEWDNDNRKFIQGSHKSGEAKGGKKYWIYNVDLCDGEKLRYKRGDKEYRVSIFAFGEEQKALFDTGQIEAVVQNKINKNTRQIEAFVDAETGDTKIRRIVFFNKLGYSDRIKEEIKEETERTRKKLYEDEIDAKDIPF